METIHTCTYIAKTLWNTNVKLSQEDYCKLFNIKKYFSDVEYEFPETQRESKYKKLQEKSSLYVFNNDDYYKTVSVWQKETPSRLQKKLLLQNN